VLVLGKSLHIEVLAGEPRPNERAVYIRLRHSKLPKGGVMFAMPTANARELASLINGVADSMVDEAADPGKPS
jgi:hypothetical protein